MMKDTIMSAVDEDSFFSDEELFANGKKYSLFILINTQLFLLLCVYFFVIFLN